MALPGSISTLPDTDPDPTGSGSETLVEVIDPSLENSCLGDLRKKKLIRNTLFVSNFSRNSKKIIYIFVLASVGEQERSSWRRMC